MSELPCCRLKRGDSIMIRYKRSYMARLNDGQIAEVLSHSEVPEWVFVKYPDLRGRHMLRINDGHSIWGDEWDPVPMIEEVKP